MTNMDRVVWSWDSLCKIAPCTYNAVILPGLCLKLLLFTSRPLIFGLILESGELISEVLL